MSKVDAQRAMREAKYERNRASGPTRREAAALRGAPTTPAVVAPVAAPSAKPARAPKAVAPEGERCGHQSMNGRACTREAGHSEKSHRYG